MKAIDILTFGSIVVDTIVRVPKDAPGVIDEEAETWTIPLGDKIRVNESEMSLGGGAGNSATGFQKLGLEAAAFGVVGDHGNLRFILHELEKIGVNTDFLTIKDNEPSSFSVILNAPNGERTVFHKRTTDCRYGATKAAALPPAKAVYMAHLYDCSEPLLWEMCKWKEANPESIWGWNPGKTQYAKGFSHYKELYPYIDVLVLNRSEAEQFSEMKAVKHEITGGYRPELFGEKGAVPKEALIESLYDVRHMADFFHTAGIKTVAITDGGRGAQIFTPDHHYFSPSQEGARVDTLGAGDAFSIGLIAAKLHGKSVREQIRWASENSNSVIKYVGAQRGQLKLDEMEQLIKSSPDSPD